MCSLELRHQNSNFYVYIGVVPNPEEGTGKVEFVLAGILSLIKYDFDACMWR
jgi:hypothetical protein